MIIGQQHKYNDLSHIHRNHNLFDYIFFLRPMLHPPVWTIVILGYYRSPVKPESPMPLIGLLLLSSLAAGWGYVVNQIADIESDRINHKLFFLPENFISVKSACIIAAILAIGTIAGAFCYDVLIGILFTIGIGLGYFYSGKPFLGKNRPVTSTLLNGVAHGMMPFIAGFVGAGGRFGHAAIYSLPYFFSVVAVFIGTTLPDIEGDSATDKRTPGVVLGIRYSAVVMTLSLMMALLSGLVFLDFLFLIAANISLAFYLAAVINPRVRKTVIAVKVSTLLLSIVACWRFWPYAILLVSLFIFTRIYYHYRFGMVYPELT
jgi:4-hydroxybenzoate polyprenyltransferase